MFAHKLHDGVVHIAPQNGIAAEKLHVAVVAVCEGELPASFQVHIVLAVLAEQAMNLCGLFDVHDKNHIYLLCLFLCVGFYAQRVCEIHKLHQSVKLVLGIDGAVVADDLLQFRIQKGVEAGHDGGHDRSHRLIRTGEGCACQPPGLMLRRQFIHEQLKTVLAS